MNINVLVSLYLDTRRAKSSGKFPLKIRVFQSFPRKQKLFPTTYEFSEVEFKSIWESKNTKKDLRDFKTKLLAVELKAKNIVNEINPFNFDLFERKLYQKAGEIENVFYQYELYIEKLIKSNNTGTASNYECSMNSIKTFLDSQKIKNTSLLFFREINKNWLVDYENHSINEKGRSITTVGIYLRPLRALFNVAISERIINEEFYPFGKGKYIIPASNRVKKALTADELKNFFACEVNTVHNEKAKDFWFFSYSCNGINIKDIVLLKNKDLHDDKIVFNRAKTINTSRQNLTPIVIYLNDYSKSIIEKYAIKNRAKDDYVFDIVEKSLSHLEQRKVIQNFTRFINQHIKSLAKKNDLPDGISTYWARHSFATNSIRKGATMEFMQESLGHANLKTTQGYYAGFDSKVKEEFAKTIMNF